MSICPYMSAVDLDGNLVKVECLKHECQKYVQLMGTNPQTGVQEAKWDCADAFVPMLLIENSNMVRGTQAAIESFRNEAHKAVHKALDKVSPALPPGERDV